MLTVTRVDTKLTASFSSKEYAHHVTVESAGISHTNLLFFLRNVRRLAYAPKRGFSLIEMVVISRDLEALIRFFRLSKINAGTGTLAFRTHVWNIAVTQPRLLFKSRLTKAEPSFLRCLQSLYYQPWSPVRSLFFRKEANYQYFYVLRLLSSVLPQEVAEIVLRYLPAWSRPIDYLSF